MKATLNKERSTLEMKQFSDQFFSVIPGIEHASDVPVIQAEDLDEDVFVREWVSNNRACLIKGAVKHWPAIEKWKNKEYLIANCDNFKLSVYPHRNYNDKEKQQEGREELHFYDAVERLYENKDYILSMPGEPLFEGDRFRLMDDMKGFNFLKFQANPRVYPKDRFFLYRRASTAWHYHNVDETLMCQVIGAKRIALVPPSIARPKYVKNFFDKELQLKGETLDPNIDFKPSVITTEEGDALYIPPYWHHGVVPVDGEIGLTVAHCWASPWHIMGDFSNYFVRELYRLGLWPLRKLTPFIPFIASFSAFMHYKRKIEIALSQR